MKINNILKVLLLWGMLFCLSVFARADSGLIDQIEEKGQIIIDLFQYKWDPKIYGRKEPWVEMSYNFDEITPDGAKALTMEIKPGNSWLRGLELGEGSWRKYKFSNVSFWLKTNGRGEGGRLYFITDEDETETSPYYSYYISFHNTKWQMVTVPFADFENSKGNKLDFGRVRDIQFQFMDITAPFTISIGPLVFKAISSGSGQM